MGSSPVSERRRKPRRGISLPTLGLSLEELILLLEVAPRGWTEGEATGLVRRIARELSNQTQLSEGADPAYADEWKLYAAATDEEVKKELGFTKADEGRPDMGYVILMTFVDILKASLREV